jgi:hypothetical protein
MKYWRLYRKLFLRNSGAERPRRSKLRLWKNGQLNTVMSLSRSLERLRRG